MAATVEDALAARGVTMRRKPTTEATTIQTPPVADPAHVAAMQREPALRGRVTDEAIDKIRVVLDGVYERLERAETGADPDAPTPAPERSTA